MSAERVEYMPEDAAWIQANTCASSSVTKTSYEAAFPHNVHSTQHEQTLDDYVSETRSSCNEEVVVNQHDTSTPYTIHDQVMAAYRGEIPRFLLSGEEEGILSRAVQAGKAAAEKLYECDEFSDGIKSQLQQDIHTASLAKEAFIVANRGLIKSIALKYDRAGVLFDDLIQEGSIAVLRAAEEFDFTKGVKFGTFATEVIKKQVRRAATEQIGPIRRTEHTSRDIYKVMKAEHQLTQQLRRNPNDTEVDQLLGDTVRNKKEVRRLKEIQILSVDSVVKEGKDVTLLDTIPSSGPALEDIVIEKDEVSCIRNAIRDTLNPREQSIINAFFYHDIPQCQIAEELGVSSSRVQQIVSRSLKKLRESIVPNGIPQDMETHGSELEQDSRSLEDILSKPEYNALKLKYLSFYDSKKTFAQISQHRLKHFMGSVYKKLNVKNEYGLIPLGIHSGLVDLSVVAEKLQFNFSNVDALTAQEWKVFEAVSENCALSYAEICNSLSLQTKTLQNHLTNINKKLGLQGREQAVLYYFAMRASIKQKAEEE